MAKITVQNTQITVIRQSTQQRPRCVLMLIERNSSYQQLSGLGEMILSVIQRPDNDNDGQWMSIKELSALLKCTFKGYKEEVGTFRKIGTILSRPEYRFKRKHQNSGMIYWVKVME